MNDIISRADAIKDAESWVAVDEYEKHLQKNVVEWLKEFPPAELSTNLASLSTDCISRQTAIERFDYIRPRDPMTSDYTHGIDVGIALCKVAIREQPPAQLGTNLAEVGTDCISREQAIKATWQDTGYTDPFNVMTAIRDRIKQLPPIQPEIVRCKDCKHWKDSDGVFRRGIGVESKCPLNLHQVYEGTFFCGLAERREVQDENDKTTNNTTNA